METREPFEFSAFISYRHLELDMEIAKAIQRRIENYVIPRPLRKDGGKRKFQRVFRDQDELPLMADLGEGIRHALDQSEWLIVVCTPELPKSKWCMAEIDHFIRQGRRDKILPVLLSGKPEESFPPSLRFVETEDGKTEEREPLAADLTGKDPRAQRKKLHLETLRLIAPMLGVGYDDLRRRARERFIRNLALIASGAAAILAAFTLYALGQNQIISRQRDQALVNQSRFLSAQAMAQLDAGNTQVAMLLALEALPKDLQKPERPFVPEAAAALRTANLGRSQGMYTLAGLCPYDKPYTYLEAENLMIQKTSYDNYLLREPFTHEEAIPSLGGFGDFDYDEGRGRLYGLKTDSIQIIQFPERSVRSLPIDRGDRSLFNVVRFLSDGERVLAGRMGGSADNYFDIYDIQSGECLYTANNKTFFDDNRISDYIYANFGDFCFTPDGRSMIFNTSGRLNTQEEGHRFYSLDLATYELQVAFRGTPGKGYIGFAYSPDGKQFIAKTGDALLEVRDSQSWELLHTLGTSGQSGPYRFSFHYQYSPDSRYIVSVVAFGPCQLYNAETGEELTEHIPGASVGFIGFVDAHTLVYREYSASRVIQFLNIETGESSFVNIPGGIRSDTTYSDPISGCRLSGDSLLVDTRQGRTQFWRRLPVLGAQQVFAEAGGSGQMAFSPDGSKFAVSDGNTGALRVYDARNIRPLYGLGINLICRQLFWSPDGQYILAASSRDVAIFDAQTGEKLSSLPGLGGEAIGGFT